MSKVICGGFDLGSGLSMDGKTLNVSPTSIEIGEEKLTGEVFNGNPVYVRAVELNNITAIGLNATSISGTGIVDVLSVDGYIQNENSTTKITLPFFSMQTNGNILSDVRISAQLFSQSGQRVLRFNVVLAADNSGTIRGAVDRPVAIVKYTKTA